MQGHSPSTHLRGGAQPLREQVVRLGSSLRPAPRGSFLRDGSPSPQRCEGFPLCTPQSGRSAPRPGLLSRVEKVGKDTPGGHPWTPLGGIIIPPAARCAAPPRRTLPLGVGGGVGLCFPPRRIGVSGCRYPFLYSGKKLLRARWEAQAVHSR